MSTEIYRAKTFQQVYDAGKAWLIGRGSDLTNFNVGGRVNSLLEAEAIIISRESKDMYVGLRLSIPVAAIEGLRFTRKGGIASTGTIRFSRVGAAGQDYPIPIGTQILFEGKTYETSAAGSILTGNTESGDIASVCLTLGVEGDQPIGAIDTENGAGSILAKPEGIFYAENFAVFTGGQDEESDDDRITRFQTHIKGLGRSTPQGLLAGALSVEGVRSATLRERFPVAGWNTIYADDGDGFLDAAVKTEVEKVMNGDNSDPENYPGYRSAGIQMQVLAPSIVTQNFILHIFYLQTAQSTPGDLETIASSAVQQYVNSLRLGQDIIHAAAIAAVKNAHKDIYDVAITTPSANVVINAEQMAKTGTTVTVTSSLRALP
jgi:hypothetical protein